MSTSLSEQLLQAGLITKEKIEQVEKEEKQRKQLFKNRRNNSAPKKHKTNITKKQLKKTKKSDDLKQFYRKRNQAEKEEKAEKEIKRREETLLRKARKAQIRALIKPNLINNENPDLRYNFLISNTVKYTFVTQERLEQLVKGDIAITMYANNHVLVPKAIAEKIKLIDSNHLVFIPEKEEKTR